MEYMNLSELSNIAMAQATPDIVRINQMERELEESRYEELVNRIGSIEEYSKTQAKLAEDEISFLKQQLELALQRVANAEAGERKANLKTNLSIICAIVSTICAIISIL